ncbi:hypothetical protein KIF24_27005 [Micromonospora sp. Llam7]|nr:hypothetical protein [Micromonospora tarapacensis]
MFADPAADIDAIVRGSALRHTSPDRFAGGVSRPRSAPAATRRVRALARRHHHGPSGQHPHGGQRPAARTVAGAHVRIVTRRSPHAVAGR